MKLGVYVGSFNPVHMGHMELVNGLIDMKIVDKIIIVPSKNYWTKTNLIDIDDRINMLKFFENENIIIDTKRNELDYTYEVLDSIKDEYNDELFLIIGSDNLERFHLWKNVNKILENKVIVVNRGNLKTDKLDEHFIVVSEINPLNTSSTEIRRRLENDESIEELVDNRVIYYIKRKKLYKENEL